MKSRWMFAALAAGALALGACGDDDADSGGDDDDGGRLSAADAVSGTNGALATAAAPQAGESLNSGPIPGGIGDEPLAAAQSVRKIIFTADLTLRADDVSRAFNEASSLARASGGYVEKSNFSNDAEDGERRAAGLSIRVPTQNYDSLLASLRSMSDVSVDHEGSNSNEVTEEYIDLQSRQRNLERTEQQYLTLLNEAKTVADILTVQDRLSGVRSQIEQIQGRLRVLDDLADFATVNVSIAPVVARVEDKGGDWKLSEVFVDSWQGSFEVARYVAAAGIVVLVAFAWLGVPALVIYVIARKLRRSHQVPGATAES